MSDAGWVAFLDSLESELHAVRRSPGRVRLPEFIPPTGLGAMPGTCATRARDLLGELGRVQDQIRDEMRRTVRQLDELRHLDPRGPRPSARFDSRA